MLSERLQKSQKSVRDLYDPHFSWLENEELHWPAYSKILKSSKIALLTSCGIYRQDTQIPFDAWNHYGDPSFREIHIDTPRSRLQIAHNHYDHKFANNDLNCVLPIDHMLGFQAEGFIGSLYPWVYSFMGYNPQPKQLVEESISMIATRLKQDKVDAVLLTPC